MPFIPNEGVPRRVLPVFYVLDVSGSMQGTPIAALNRAMEETVDALKEQATNNADAQVKIAVLQFSSGCSWVTENGLEDAEDFIWQDLVAGGLTDIGDALNELNDKLSRKGFLNNATGNYMPIIIFMTDGYATDNYTKELENIRDNKWFRRATKIGFALGDQVDASMICNVVGNPEAVIKTTDLGVFAKLLKFVSVTSSMVRSQSVTEDTNIDAASIIKMIDEDDSTSIQTFSEEDVPDYKPEVPADDAVSSDSDDEWSVGEDW